MNFPVSIKRVLVVDSSGAPEGSRSGIASPSDFQETAKTRFLSKAI